MTTFIVICFILYAVVFCFWYYKADRFSAIERKLIVKGANCVNCTYFRNNLPSEFKDFPYGVSGCSRYQVPTGRGAREAMNRGICEDYVIEGNTLKFLQEYPSDEQLLAEEKLCKVISGLLVTHWSCSCGGNIIIVTYGKLWGNTGLYVNAQLQERKKIRLSPFGVKVSGKLPDGESVEATIKGILSFDCEVRVNNKLIYTSK